MLTPFSSEDLSRIFDSRVLTRGRSLVLLGTVEVALQDPSIAVTVEHLGLRHTASITPSALGHRVVFANKCSCGQSACAHMAAGALAALDRYPVLRKPVQKSFLDTLAIPAAAERQRLVFELSPGEPPHACFVNTILIGERSGRLEPTTPARILSDRANPESTRILAKLLGGGDISRVPVSPAAVPSVLGLLARLGKARWHATGEVLIPGEERTFQANVPPNLPPKSAIILGEAGPWYVDGASGAVGRVRLRQAAVPSVQTSAVPQRPIRAPFSMQNPGPRSPTFQRPEPPRFIAKRPDPVRPGTRRAEPVIPQTADPIILQGTLTPVLRLRKIESPR